MRLIKFCFILLTIIQLSCRNSTGIPVQKSVELSDLPKDFHDFYQKFHNDSTYQMAHIIWPLKGEKADLQEDGSYKKTLADWEPENWALFHSPDMTDVGLKRQYETLSDVLIIERLQYPMVNYGLERQFFKDQDNEWRLIFYSEMQGLR